MSSTEFDILADTRATVGARLRIDETGGGCIAYTVRLESGHWMVATNEALATITEQLEWEAENNRSLGWIVGFYDHDDETEWTDKGWIVGHIDLDATAEDLPKVLLDALKLFRDEVLR